MDSFAKILARHDVSSDALEEEVDCGIERGDYNKGLHIAAVFIILATSTLGAFLPLIISRVKALKIPLTFIQFVKFFGTGVIIATAFIHLLPSALGQLTNPCLSSFWTEEYTAWATAIAMMAMFTNFLVEYIATRQLRKMDKDILRSRRIGMVSEKEEVTDILPSHHHNNNGADKGSEVGNTTDNSENRTTAAETQQAHLGHHHQNPGPIANEAASPAEQNAARLAILILEFGILFHSIIIGMALSVTDGDEFKSLLCALVFHQFFEGLGLGARLAVSLPVGRKSPEPWLYALAYGLTTPLGVAIGLGVRNSYNPNSPNALLTQGILDGISAGILLYVGLVELLAHDFLSPEMLDLPVGRITFYIISMLVGAAAMALVGKWA